jgi:hypothetical protein
MRCLAGALGLRLRCRMVYLGVLFMGFLPRNTVAVIIAYIFVALRNELTFTILCNSFLSPPSVCYAHTAADFVKCESYCLIILVLKISLY